MKKPVIFISHANDDKPRLVPYIERMITKLGADTKIWIDTPDGMLGQMYLSADARRRVQCIPSGSNWLSEIEKALDDSAIVLAFWSRAALIGRREVFKRELWHAAGTNKLFQVCLDPDARTQIPDPWYFEQVQDVSGLSQGDSTIFDRVLEDIESRLERLPTDKRHDLLPALVDRSEVSRLIVAAAEKLNARLEQRANERRTPASFIIPCYQSDDHDKLIERLVEADGPAATHLYSSGNWVTSGRPLSIPHECLRSRLPAGEFFKANESMLRNTLASAQVAPSEARTTLFHATVCAAQLGRQRTAVLRAWRSLWRDEIPKRMIAWGVDTVPCICLLFVKLDNHRSWLKSHSSLCLELENLAPIANDLDCLVGGSLPRLGQISAGHAANWAQRPEVRSMGGTSELNTLINKLFSDDTVSMTMQSFCEAVYGSKWWDRVLRDDYGVRGGRRS